MGTKCFSLRQHLIDNGVTTEEATREHLANAFHIIRALPHVSVTRYRVGKRNPNHTTEGVHIA
jgi:hypothetical protein